MFNDKSIIIAGSGNSIPFDDDQYKNSGCGLPEQLASIIQNNYSIGLNYFHQYGCATTLTTFVDATFYLNNKGALQNLPFIIGKVDKTLPKPIPKNTFLLPIGKHYMGDHAWNINYRICNACNYKVSLKDGLSNCPKCHKYLHPCGFYHSHLNGIFSLSLAIALGFTNIYLLGYDGCELNGKTHFYQKQIEDMQKFRGVGTIVHPRGKSYRTNTYNSPDKMNKVWFAPFKDLNVNIYNVSEQSVIETFPKISYSELYMQFIKYQPIDQNQARTVIQEYVLQKTNELC